MYQLAGPLADVEVDPGSNLLVLGPAMSGKQRLAYEILAAGTADDDAVIVVSTADAADRVFADLEDVLGESPDGKSIGVIDCVSRQQGVEDLEEDDQRKYASSPVDMTGIGVSLSELLETYTQSREHERTRVCLDSISTLLVYSELQTVFRFLHVFTGRVQNAGGLGLYLMDPSAHDDQTLNTIKGLFDGVIEVPEEGEVTFSGLDS